MVRRSWDPERTPWQPGASWQDRFFLIPPPPSFPTVYMSLQGSGRWKGGVFILGGWLPLVKLRNIKSG